MAGDGPPLPPSAQPTAPPSLHSASPSNSRAAATPPLSPPLAAPLHGHCPPPPVLTPSASGTSLLPRERITLTPSFEQQTCGELSAAGEVLGDPQPHASGEVHGELPKKICKKKCSEARGVRKVTSDSRHVHLQRRARRRLYFFRRYSCLQQYIEEGFHPCTSDFNILKWWDVNSERYPILGNMARDVLAVPASTVASESAFSTCGRVITDHISSLAPETVEALMCYGDWIRASYSKEAGEERRCEE